MRAHTDSAIRNFCQSKTPQEAAINWQPAIHKLSEESSNDRAWFYWWCYRNIKVTTKNNVTFYLAPSSNDFDGESINISTTVDSSRIITLTMDLIEQIHIPDPIKLYQKLGIF
ncbi:MAG: hypothetical protein ACRCZS_02405 [Chroococcidiopsis sp.]